MTVNPDSQPCRRQFDENVDIALRSIIAARARTEQRSMGDALRLEIGFMSFEFGDDFIAIHRV